MLVTIGMPVYNRPIELERALKAVLSQTYADIEIVISNNSSTDSRVEELVKKYAQADPRIKYFFQTRALPVIDNFKFVLENASGEYFMWLADDDWIDAGYVESCVLFLNDNKDYSIACGQCAYHDTAGGLIEKLKMPSIDADLPSERMIGYYRHVKLNGYFYGIRKTVLARKIPLQNMVAFDWLYLAAFIYEGKAKVLDNVMLHITAGGLSNDTAELNRNLGSNNFMTRNFVGLTASANAAKDIFQTKYYPISFLKRMVLSARIFFTVLSKTFMWDAVHVKRMIFGKRSTTK
jgi:glycosyltransferase involved in cell wall biosynthesis